MARNDSLSRATLDGTQVFRCMLVGMGDEQAAICTRALDPMLVIRVPSAAQACAQVSTILPLVVVVAQEGDVTRELEEIVGACGAELVVAERSLDASALSKTLLEALRVADARRSAL